MIRRSDARVQQATLAYNQAEYQRQATLGKQDFASQATVQEWKSKADEAAAQVLNAKAAIETAQINLNYTTVNAPFNGVVTRHLVDKGALVGVGSPTKLATIIQLDPLYVYFTISEPQILRIKVNNAKAGIEFRTTDLSKIPVEIGLQGEEGFPHLGHMDYAAPQVDASTGTLEVRAIFDNKERGLLPGLFVRVRTPVEKLDKRFWCRMWPWGRARRDGTFWWSVRTMSSSANSSRRASAKARTGSSSRVDPGEWVVTEGVQRALPAPRSRLSRRSLRSRR